MCWELSIVDFDFLNIHSIWMGGKANMGSRENTKTAENTNIIVLVLWGCHSKFPPIWWFPTKQIYSFTVLNAQNPKASRPMLLPEVLRICSSLLLVSGGCWQSKVWGLILYVKLTWPQCPDLVKDYSGCFSEGVLDEIYT